MTKMNFTDSIFNTLVPYNEEAKIMCFEEVAPGISVNTNSGIKISFPHPDPCVIIQPEDKSSYYGSPDTGEIFAFSTEEKANSFIAATEIQGTVTVEMSWEELVEKFHEAVNAIIDPTPGPGFVSVVPLRFDI